MTWNMGTELSREFGGAREGEAPAEPLVRAVKRLGRSLALPVEDPLLQSEGVND